jgi:XRE family transcriptional regulator, aerobic/anaerobic benzoate catabolism transcriptional regulator
MNAISPFVSAPPTEAATTQDALLGALAERVRTLRAQRGMTRKILARDSGVSERYLALMESGEGNASLTVLAAVARALSVPLPTLLGDQQAESAERQAVAARIKKLSHTDFTALRDWLESRTIGGSTGYQERNGKIALIGLRGAGKSTLGQQLATRIGCPFVELDKEVEREAGMQINEIFLLSGQAGYRRYERMALERVVRAHDKVVIATGGSIVSEIETYDWLLAHCRTVWLKAKPEEHMARVIAQGDTRPMKGNKQAMDDLKRILEGRAALYGRADLTINTAGDSVEHSLHTLWEKTK